MRQSFNIQYPPWLSHPPTSKTMTGNEFAFGRCGNYSSVHSAYVRQIAWKDLQNPVESCGPRTLANPIRFWMPNAHISLDCTVIILPLFKTSCRGQRLLSIHLSPGLRARNVFTNIIKNVNEFVCLPTVHPFVSHSVSYSVGPSVIHVFSSSIEII